MTDAGKVTGIFRYPVKSMLGESLEASPLGIDGIPGDRSWGVRDEQRGDFFVGKRCARLMSCRAWYDDGACEVSSHEVAGPAVPQIGLPDGQTFRADSEDAAARVAHFIGRDVSLWPVVPEARQVEARDQQGLLEEMAEMMAREGDESIPDFSNPAPELLEVQARGGPFFDAFPLLLLTEASVRRIAGAATGSQIDARRFRPNLMIETGESGPFPEQDWIGRRLRIGSAVLKVQSACIRCVMTTHGFADLPKDPRVMRALVREGEGNLGVYATVDEPGSIRQEDPATLLD